MKLNRIVQRAAFAAAVALSAASLASPALASLGGTADSVGSDSSVLRGLLRSTPQVQYDVQQIDSSTGTVREYVTRGGQVFAVTWQGIAPPDFQQLLAQYFSRLQPAAAAATAAHGPGADRHFRIDQSDFVMRSVGRQGDFHGVAYLPALVPQGVDVGTLP